MDIYENKYLKYKYLKYKNKYKSESINQSIMYGSGEKNNNQSIMYGGVPDWFTQSYLKYPEILSIIKHFQKTNDIIPKVHPYFEQYIQDIMTNNYNYNYNNIIKNIDKLFFMSYINVGIAEENFFEYLDILYDKILLSISSDTSNVKYQIFTYYSLEIKKFKKDVDYHNMREVIPFLKLEYMEILFIILIAIYHNSIDFTNLDKDILYCAQKRNKNSGFLGKVLTFFTIEKPSYECYKDLIIKFIIICNLNILQINSLNDLDEKVQKLNYDEFNLYEEISTFNNVLKPNLKYFEL